MILLFVFEDPNKRGKHLEVYGLLALDDSNEVAGNDPSLMDELIEGMLAIGSWLSKVNLSGLKRKSLSSDRHTFAIALHRNLQKNDIIRSLLHSLARSTDFAKLSAPSRNPEMLRTSLKISSIEPTIAHGCRTFSQMLCSANYCESLSETRNMAGRVCAKEESTC